MDDFVFSDLSTSTLVEIKYITMSTSKKQFRVDVLPERWDYFARRPLVGHGIFPQKKWLADHLAGVVGHLMLAMAR